MYSSEPLLNQSHCSSWCLENCGADCIRVSQPGSWLAQLGSWCKIRKNVVWEIFSPTFEATFHRLASGNIYKKAFLSGIAHITSHKFSQVVPPCCELWIVQWEASPNPTQKQQTFCWKFKFYKDNVVHRVTSSPVELFCRDDICQKIYATANLGP